MLEVNAGEEQFKSISPRRQDYLVGLTAAVMHGMWAESFRKERPRELNRWKPLSDEDTIWLVNNIDENEHIRMFNSKTEVDILNLPFESLPPSYQKENLLSAEHVIGVLVESLAKDSRIHLFNVASSVHKAWLRRNEWAQHEGDLNVDYEFLPIEEQNKDLDVVFAALGILQRELAFKVRLNQETLNRQIGRAETEDGKGARQNAWDFATRQGVQKEYPRDTLLDTLRRRFQRLRLAWLKYKSRKMEASTAVI